MKIAIVGAEAAKFTTSGKADAIFQIEKLLSPPHSILVSGHCHLGGIDIWAEEVADRLQRKKLIFPPEYQCWEAYKARNIKIAIACDVIYCIVVRRYADSYSGMKFKLCYHCNTTSHCKGGGCWTVKQAEKLGKKGQIIELNNEEDF